MNTRNINFLLFFYVLFYLIIRHQKNPVKHVKRKLSEKIKNWRVQLFQSFLYKETWKSRVSLDLKPSLSNWISSSCCLAIFGDGFCSVVWRSVIFDMQNQQFADVLQNRCLLQWHKVERTFGDGYCSHY